MPVLPARHARHLPRLGAIAADSQAAFVLTTSRTMARSRDLGLRTAGLDGLKWQATDEIPLELGTEWREPVIDSRTLAFLQYTSGSTGEPRGVMVSHGNLFANCGSIQRLCGFTQESLGVPAAALPRHGTDCGLLEPLYAGFPVIVMPPCVLPAAVLRWLAAASRYRVNTLVAPNFAYELCARKISAEQRAGLRLDQVEIALSGAEPVRWSTIERFADVFAPCGFRKEAFRPHTAWRRPR